MKTIGHAGTREERVKLGRDKRKELGRKALCVFDPAKRKLHPIDVLLASTEGRLPKLLPEKYRRMSLSPFAFFRGAVSVTAADLAAHPNSGLAVQLCGDAHVQNMGAFATPDGHLVFDINDFDETIAGPWEWDVKRLAASLVLAGMDAEHKNQRCAAAVQQFAVSYCATIQSLSEEPVLDAARHIVRRLKKSPVVTSALKQAERASHAMLAKKYTEKDGHGKLCLKTIPGQLWRVGGAERQAVLDSLHAYEQTLAPERRHFLRFYQERDVGFKVVGTGSVGLRDYVVLLYGGKDDALFIQIKEEVHSAYAQYLPHDHHDNQGQRVCEGQRRIQPLSDLLLGWTRIGDDDYLVRQLNDHKGTVSLEALRGDGLESLAAVAGELLARGHARSGDSVAIGSYIGDRDRIVPELVKFAETYADLTVEDFKAFKKAIKAGRIKLSSPKGN